MKLSTVGTFFLAYCVCGLQHVQGGKSGDGYFYGRATFYDDNQQGACQYFSNIPEYYAAWPDSQEGFAYSCGTCWEIQCMDDSFHDGYGEHIDRSSACKDPNKKVVVKIVDACPCQHYNYYSNKRWCCGDRNHIDLGRKAYLELADEHWGVIGLKWRDTSCDRLGVVEGSWTSASSSASSSSSSSNQERSKAGSSSGSWSSSDGTSGSSTSSSGTSQFSQQKEWGLGALSGVLTEGSETFQDKGWNRRHLRH